MPRTKPIDCTCHGFHTDAVADDFTDVLIRALIEMEACPAERRALERILVSPR